MSNEKITRGVIARSENQIKALYENALDKVLIGNSPASGLSFFLSRGNNGGGGGVVPKKELMSEGVLMINLY